MKIKNAFIIPTTDKAIKEKYYFDKEVYHMVLDEEMFNDFKRRGLRVKDIKFKDGNHRYLIRVYPIINNKIINEPNNKYEDLFLYKDNIEIDFKIKVRNVNEHIFTMLTFNVEELD